MPYLCRELHNRWLERVVAWYPNVNKELPTCIRCVRWAKELALQMCQIVRGSSGRYCDFGEGIASSLFNLLRNTSETICSHIQVLLGEGTEWVKTVKQIPVLRTQASSLCP